MTCRRFADLDAGLQKAVRAAGGARALARKLGLREAGLPWARCPQDRVFEVAEATGVAPIELRPDLADWIAAELERRAVIAQGGGLSRAELARAVRDRWSGPAIDEQVTDLLTTIGAVWFVAGLKGLKPLQVFAGQARAEQSARALAMALAKVEGRARSTHIAAVFGVTRQNVDNATERYLRARDGDDPDDFIIGQFPDGTPRVLERGSNRLRPAKSADETLWPVEAQFGAFLAGEAPVPRPERRRA